jgi:RNA polymerase sigma-70 factor (ECF subfamily)
MNQPMTSSLLPTQKNAVLEDRALVDALISGDDRAWNEFMHRYGPTLRRCISRVTSRFSSVTSCDDEQEIFSVLCLRLVQNGSRRLAAFDPTRGASLGTWLGTLAIHTTYDYLRQRRRESNRHRQAALGMDFTSGPNPLDEVLERERTLVARQLLGDIPARDRQFLDHVCAETLNAKEIAEQMGISVATVYSKKHKLIGRLARMADEQRATTAA